MIKIDEIIDKDDAADLGYGPDLNDLVPNCHP